MAIIRAEAVKAVAHPAQCDAYEASVRKGHRSVEDYAAYVRAALPRAEARVRSRCRSAARGRQVVRDRSRLRPDRRDQPGAEHLPPRPDQGGR